MSSPKPEVAKKMHPGGRAAGNVSDEGDNVSSMDARETLAFLTESLQRKVVESDPSSSSSEGPDAATSNLEFSIGTTASPGKVVGKGKAKRMNKSQATLKKKASITKVTSVACGGIDYSKWDRMAAELSDSEDSSISEELGHSHECSIHCQRHTSHMMKQYNDDESNAFQTHHSFGGEGIALSAGSSSSSILPPHGSRSRGARSVDESGAHELDGMGSQNGPMAGTAPLGECVVRLGSSEEHVVFVDSSPSTTVTASPGIGDEERINKKRGKVELESATMAPVKSTMRWRIENYSTRRNERAPLYSPSHEDQSGCKWRFIFYPNGEKSDNWVSLFIEVPDSEELPFGWSRCASFTITIPNSSHPTGPSYQRNDTHVFRGIGGDVSWGWPHFIECDRLLSDGFIRDNTLEIVAEISLVEVLSEIKLPDLPGYMNAACTKGDLHNMRHCLDQGVSVNAMYLGNSPLHAVCMAPACHAEALDFLLRRGASVDLSNADGESALLLAAYYGHRELVARLLEAGADTDLGPSKNGLCALGAAAQQGEVGTARLLIQHGAPLGGLGVGCCVPLKQALQLKRWKCAEALVREGCSVQANAGDEDYLVYSARHGTARVIHVLLQHGADPNACDKGGDNVVAILAERELLDLAVVVSRVYGGSAVRCSKDRQRAQRIKLLLQVHLKRMQRQIEKEEMSPDRMEMLNGIDVDELLGRKRGAQNHSADAAASSGQAAEDYARQLMEEEAAAEEKRKKKANKKKKKRDKKKIEKRKELEEKRMEEERKLAARKEEERLEMERKRIAELEQKREQQQKEQEEQRKLEAWHRKQEIARLKLEEDQAKALAALMLDDPSEASSATQEDSQENDSAEEWIVPKTREKHKHQTKGMAVSSKKTNPAVSSNVDSTKKPLNSNKAKVQKRQLGTKAPPAKINGQTENEKNAHIANANQNRSRTVTGKVTKVFGGTHGYCFVDTTIYCARDVVERLASWPPGEGDSVEVTAERDDDRGNWKATRYVLLRASTARTSHVVARVASSTLNPLEAPSALVSPTAGSQDQVPQYPKLLEPEPVAAAFADPQLAAEELLQPVLSGDLSSVPDRPPTSVAFASQFGAQDGLAVMGPGPTPAAHGAGLPRLSIFQSLHMESRPEASSSTGSSPWDAMASPQDVALGVVASVVGEDEVDTPMFEHDGKMQFGGLGLLDGLKEASGGRGFDMGHVPGFIQPSPGVGGQVLPGEVAGYGVNGFFSEEQSNEPIPVRTAQVEPNTSRSRLPQW